MTMFVTFAKEFLGVSYVELPYMQIQGTGAVVLSGFFNAARLASAASGLPLSNHRILFFGAGSAGIGVAKQLLSFFKFQGMSETEAKKQIWVRFRP